MLTEDDKNAIVAAMGRDDWIEVFDLLEAALKNDLFADGRFVLTLNHNQKKIITQNMKDMNLDDPNTVMGLILDKFAPNYWRARETAIKAGKIKGMS